MAATLVRRQRVDLVDDDGTRRGEHRAPRLRAEQNVERLGSRHDHVGRPPPHTRPFGLRGVTGAHQRADVHVGKAERCELRADSRERCCEILLDVVGQGLQRRDIDDERLIRQRSLDALSHQTIYGREERGERLPRAGGRGDQHISPRLDQRPGARLGLGGCTKMLAEPGIDRRMEELASLHGWRVRGGRSTFLNSGSSGKCKRSHSRFPSHPHERHVVVSRYDASQRTGKVARCDRRRNADIPSLMIGRRRGTLDGKPAAGFFASDSTLRKIKQLRDAAE